MQISDQKLLEDLKLLEAINPPQTPQITVPGCRLLVCLDKGSHYLAKVEVSHPMRQCRKCGGRILKLNGYAQREFFHTPSDKPVKVVVDNRRMECVRCGSTAGEVIPPLCPGSRFTFDLLELVAKLSITLRPRHIAEVTGLPVRLVPQALRTWQENLIRRLRPPRVAIRTRLKDVEGVFIGDIDSRMLLAITAWREEYNPIARGFSDYAPEEVHLEFDERLIDLAQTVFGGASSLRVDPSSIVDAAARAYRMTLDLECSNDLLSLEVDRSLQDLALGVDMTREDALANKWPSSYSAFKAHALIQGVTRGEASGDGWQLVSNLLSDLRGHAGHAFCDFLAAWEKFEMLIKTSLHELTATDCWLERDYLEAAALALAERIQPQRRRTKDGLKAMVVPVVSRAVTRFSDEGYTSRQKSTGV